jgi:HEAT repeat protein
VNKTTKMYSKILPSPFGRGAGGEGRDGKHHKNRFFHHANRSHPNPLRAPTEGWSGEGTTFCISPRAFFLYSLMILLATVAWTGALKAADDAGDPLVDTIVNLVSDKDKDLRAIGLQQVREEVKGAATTRRFADLLPKLSPDARAGLIDALGSRGDKTARPAVVEMLKTPNEQVQAAAIRALGILGEAADVTLLAQPLAEGAGPKKTAAQRSLEQLRGEGVDKSIVQALKTATDPRQQTGLIGIVERRKELTAVPVLLDLADSDKAEVRAAAMQTLGQLAGTQDVPKIVEKLLKAESVTDRDAAEKAIMFVCMRIKDADKRADPLLLVWAKLGEDQKTIVLPALGRLGSPKTLKIVEEAMAGDNAQRRDAGVKALCNWPDASVSGMLLDLVQTSDNANYRSLAMRALSRVAVLRDKRSDAERLDLLKKIMTLTTLDEQRNLVLDRAKAIRTIDSLRFVLSYIDKPEFAQRSCATVVELAHYRELRDPNKDEFDKALDKVIAICKDAVLVDRAQRYQRGETVEIRAKTAQ